MEHVSREILRIGQTWRKQNPQIVHQKKLFLSYVSIARGSVKLKQKFQGITYEHFAGVKTFAEHFNFAYC